MSLKNKKFLITAGPTWVAIDNVRVISNIASGETGILLARSLLRRGTRVTLFLGPGDRVYKDNRVKIIRFRFFEELRQALRKELKASRYDFIIHSAAVSDFAPESPIRGKLRSDRPLVLRLEALPKLSADIRRLAPKARLALFKLESGIKDEGLVSLARKTLSDSRADLIVANRIEPRYKAYILDGQRVYFSCASKQEMVNRLIEVLEKG